MVPPPGTTTTTTNPQAPPPPPPSGPAAASSRRCSSSMCTTLWRPVPILVLSGVLRVLMLLYGLHQDATSLVKYTDIDYLVFTDAARYTASLGEERGSGEGRWRWGGDPYERETYRYTPLLAWLLVPTTWGGVAWFSFGKVLFAAGDLLAGYGIIRLLVQRHGMQQDKAVKWAAAIWLLNPMVPTISTRGSSEGLLGAMVIALVAAVQARSWWVAGFWMGLSVHWKIYPVIYAVAIVWWMGGLRRPAGTEEGRVKVAGVVVAPAAPAAAVEKEERGNSNGDQTISHHLRGFITYPRLVFSISSLGTFTLLNLAMYALYGAPFLKHTYLHHLTRLDHRHNFSPYNTLLYLVSSPPGSSDSTLPWPSIPFIPQMALSAVLLPLAHAKRDLVGTMFAQTFAFVTFNKVCTSQYFMWYLVLFPFYLPSSTFARNPALGVSAAALWAATQAAWLAHAYNLEFLALQTFFPWLWATALAFFAVNVWILGIVVQDLGHMNQP